MSKTRTVTKTTRYDLIAELYNSGVTSIKRIITKVKAAEKKGVLIVKSTNEKNDSFYERNVKWYLGQLNRKGLISGYTSVVGRPAKARKSTGRLAAKAPAKKSVKATATKAKKAPLKAKTVKAKKNVKKTVTKAKKNVKKTVTKAKKSVKK